jgi:hypothetical protein
MTARSVGERRIWRSKAGRRGGEHQTNGRLWETCETEVTPDPHHGRIDFTAALVDSSLDCRGGEA